MNRVDAAPAADVAGHILAYADRSIHGAEDGGLALARKSAVGPERYGQGGARQVHHPGVGRAQRRLQQQLRGIVGGSEDRLRAELVDLRGEIGAKMRLVGGHVHIHAVMTKDNDAGLGCIGFDPARRQFAKKFLVLAITEFGDAGHHAGFVAARG